jgi:hypothetical protein
MPPVNMVAVLTGVALFGLLFAAILAWVLTIYHLVRLAICRHQDSRAGFAAGRWAGTELPGDAVYHRRRIVRGVRLFVGCLLAALALHLLGELASWLFGAPVLRSEIR